MFTGKKWPRFSSGHGPRGEHRTVLVSSCVRRSSTHVQSSIVVYQNINPFSSQAHEITRIFVDIFLRITLGIILRIVSKSHWYRYYELDYHDYIGQSWNQTENTYRNYKIVARAPCWRYGICSRTLHVQCCAYNWKLSKDTKYVEM